MTDTEPAKPARGLTADELGRDVSPEQAAAEVKQSTFKQMLAAMRPSFVLSQADGYPTGVKQFLQFCLILVYPAWLFAIVAGVVIYAVGYPLIYGPLWLLFWPVRRWQKKNNPEEYAATMAKHKKR